MLRNILDKCIFLFFSSFCFLIRHLPEPLGRALCLSLIKVLIFLLSRSKKIALFNIQKCFPNNTPEQNLEIYKNSIYILADNIYMFCLIPKIDKAYAEKHIDARSFVETYERLTKSSDCKSIIFVTAHFGCFELAAHLSSIIDIPLSILSRQLNLPKTEKWWNSYRELNGNEVFTRKGGYKETISRLKQGKNVAMLCDQNVKANNAVFVDLFGIPAATTITVGHAVAKTSAAIMFTVLARQKNGTYKLLSREIETPSNIEDLEEFTKQVMKNYHSALEDAIREFPDHWFWFHRRFKTRPAGQKEDFYESVDNS